MAKLCEICHKNPATIPLRSMMGRTIKRICSSCQTLQLAGDLGRIVELRLKTEKDTAAALRSNDDDGY